MSNVYVYAIVPPSAPSAFVVAGLSPGEPQVRVVHGDAIAAVVGASPAADFRSLPRQDAVNYLLAHQRVVETIMQSTATLPVKFGTVLPSEDAVVKLLARGAEILAPRLAEFADRIQLELVVTWDLNEILGEIAAEREVARLKAEVPASDVAADRAKIALGRAVKQSIDRRRDAIRARILAELRPISFDLVENALMDDRMIANVALLLSSSAGRALDYKLAQLDQEFGERLNFRCVGPLPPASFATVEVDLPSFAAIDEARRTLRLGARARLSDIKSAYHRLVSHTHPDHAGATPSSERQTAELTSAYRTLLHYLEALPLAGREQGAADGYRFDRSAIEDAILIAVHRRELGPASTEARP